VVLGLVVLAILTTSVMTMLNYISHAFTNALYQIALPFALRGFLPHNWLSLVGVRNPWAALPAVAAILVAVVACAIILLRGLPEDRRLPCVGIGLAVVALVVGVHTSFRPIRPDRIEDVRQAALFMETVYSPQPGHASPRLWRHESPGPAITRIE
jgi:peptidoglycan/LPS O-acetylase OafA/YrhL